MLEVAKLTWSRGGLAAFFSGNAAGTAINLTLASPTRQ